MSSWDSLYVKGIGYMYLYRDSVKTYRVYKENDSIFNVTKRIEK